MNLQAFVTQYNYPGSVILLEGKRAVRPEDAPLLEAVALLLARRMPDAVFRSGNAPGADALFAGGVSAVDGSRMQVIVPYSGHRSSGSRGYQVYSLDDIDVAEEPEVVYYTRQHRGAERSLDRYISGTRDVGAIKASYIIRDTVKVVGARGIDAATFGIFYDDLSNPGTGGTGHTMRVCREHGVPLLDQRAWMEWLRADQHAICP